MEQNTVYKTKMPDFNIEGRGYAIRAFGGRYTTVYFAGNHYSSFIELISDMATYAQFDEMEFMMKQFRGNGIKLRDITSQCISDLDEGCELPVQSYSYIRANITSFLNSERGRSEKSHMSRAVYNALERAKNVDICDINAAIKDAIREEIVSRLSKCRKWGDLNGITRPSGLHTNPLLYMVSRHE